MRLLCIWKAERPFQERTKTEKAQCEISSKTPFFVLCEAILKTTYLSQASSINHEFPYRLQVESRRYEVNCSLVL